MPQSMTYASLVEDVKSYTERNDEPFVSQIPRLIMMAENKLAAKVRGLGFLKVVSGTIVATDPVIVKPSRWRETSSLWISVDGKATYLKERDYNYCRMLSASSQPSVPEMYADYGYERFFVAPTPAQTHTFELSYFERPEPLSEQNQTNWTTQYAPQLILFATLLEAQVWLKLTDRAQEFSAYFEAAVADVTNESSRRTKDQTLERKPL